MNAVRLCAVIVDIVKDSMRAAPRLMISTTVLALLVGGSSALYPLGFAMFTDAAVHRDAAGMAVAVAVTGGLIATTWLAMNLDANVGFALKDAMLLQGAIRLAETANRDVGLDRFLSPSQARDLELVDDNSDRLSSAPRIVLTAASLVVRGCVVVALFATVHPLLALLPLLAAVPMAAEAKAARWRDGAEEAAAGDKRLADEMLALFLSPSAASELRIYGLADEFLALHRQAARRAIRRAGRAAIEGVALSAAAWVVFLAGFAAGIGLAVAEALKGQVSPGGIVLVVVLAGQLRPILGTVVESFGRLVTCASAFDRLVRAQRSADRRSPAEPVSSPERLRHGIELREVSYAYPGADKPSLRDVSLFLPAGATVALVGDNGAGKTTLVNLLALLLRPTSGRIEVDGLNLARIDPGGWRSAMTAVFQDFQRFELTLMESVGAGDLAQAPDVTAVRAALARAGAADLEGRLRSGLSTELGLSFSDGVNLSEGQWQKVALGRGMIRAMPLLLVFDEPTSSLDADSEHALFERVRRVAQEAAVSRGAITIVVTHRFSTVRTADLIVVLESGRVAEVGTHAQLVGGAGRYAEAFRIQAESYR